MKGVLIGWFFFLLSIPSHVLSVNPTGQSANGGEQRDKVVKKKRKGTQLKLHIPARHDGSTNSEEQSCQASLKFSPANTSKISPLDFSTEMLIAVDFDGCLVKDNISLEYNKNMFFEYVPKSSEFALGDPKKSFNDLLDKYPTAGFVIASFGFRGAINNTLSYIFEDRFKKSKRYLGITPAACGSVDGTNQLGDKNQMFKALSKQTGVPYENMIFFDDNENNIEAAKQLGINAIFAAPFNDNHLQLAQDFFDEKSKAEHFN